MAESNARVTARLAVRNTIWLSLLSYAGQFVSFGATIILARKLGPEPFGLITIAAFWSVLLGLRAKSGLSNAAIRQPRLDGELLGTAYRLDLILAAASMILSIAVALILPRLGYPPQVTWIVTVYVVLDNVTAVIGPLGLALEKELQLSRLNVIYVASTIAAYAAAIGLAYAGAGVWSLLSSNLFTTCAAVAGIYLLARRRLPWVFQMEWRFDKELARHLLRQGLPMGLANAAAASITGQWDNFLIGTYGGTKELGFYDRAYRYAQWPNTLLTGALQRVGYVTFARLQDDVPRLAHSVRLYMWVVTSLGTPMALALIFGARDVIHILLDTAWSRSADFLSILAAFSIISPFINLSVSAAYAMGKVRQAVVITLAQAVVMLAVATPLTLRWGVSGALAGLGVAILLGFGLSAHYIFTHLPLSARETFGKPLIAAAVACAATWLASQTPGWHELSAAPRLIAITLASAGTYLLCVFALNPSEVIERVRYVARAFRPPPAQEPAA